MKVKLFLVVCFLVLTLEAGEKDYLEGLKFCASHEYDKAFPIVLQEAKKDNRAAQYRLAEMYEKGRGTKVNFEQAVHWFKLAANQYSYTQKDHIQDENSSFLAEIDEQIGEESVKRGDEFILSKMDTDTPETKRLLEALHGGGSFGLQPYETNFILPLSYAKDTYKRYPSSYHLYDPVLPLSDEQLMYDKHEEVEFQLSLKKQVSYNLFGFNEYVYFAYTQKVWWQLYTGSAPFRETNYLPEVFIAIPSSHSVDEALGLKAVKLGFLHESNGQEGYRSRSWNRLYATGAWQWGNWFLATRAWYRLPEDEKPADYYNGLLDSSYANIKGDDNPDIQNYLGYGDIKLNYLNAKSQYGLLIRNNLRFNSENKGAIEFNWSYEVFKTLNTFLYLKAFHGYGESLISYNEEVTKVAIGFSFSKGLF